MIVVATVLVVCLYIHVHEHVHMHIHVCLHGCTYVHMHYVSLDLSSLSRDGHLTITGAGPGAEADSQVHPYSGRRGLHFQSGENDD